MRADDKSCMKLFKMNYEVTYIDISYTTCTTKESNGWHAFIELMLLTLNRRLPINASWTWSIGITLSLI